ncbi:hypothetical protein FHX08_004323 [Rhizobium sp. BK529]|nr:hypothetical protein [Rhizobium sp. BK529]
MVYRKGEGSPASRTFIARHREQLTSSGDKSRETQSSG